MNVFSSIKAEQIDQGVSRCIAELNEGDIIFKAHFPSYPILPGVVIIQLIQLMLEQTINQNVRLSEVTNVKFVKPIIPNDGKHITVDLQYTVQGQDLLVNANIFYGDDVVAYAKNLLYCTLS